MITSELITYFTNELQAGKTFEEITQIMVASGWQPDAVRAAFAEYRVSHPESSVVEPSQPTSLVSPFETTNNTSNVATFKSPLYINYVVSIGLLIVSYFAITSLVDFSRLNLMMADKDFDAGFALMSFGVGGLTALFGIGISLLFARVELLFQSNGRRARHVLRHRHRHQLLFDSFR